MTVQPITPVSAAAGPEAIAPTAPAAAQAPARAGLFGQMLEGVDHVNSAVLHADSMVQAFAVSDAVPLHQVTFALEQARLATELMMQVRARLLEGYQDIMRMQL